MDGSLRGRIKMLSRAHNPEAAAIDELAAWCLLRLGLSRGQERHDAARLATSIRARFIKGASREELSSGEADVVALALLTRGVPSVFVPPVAVLLARDAIS